jgi:S-adenosylmethionine synthetase
MSSTVQSEFRSTPHPRSARQINNKISPPYEVDDEPDPLQSYGKQKRGGEVAVLAEREKGAKATVLRVPILYVLSWCLTACKPDRSFRYGRTKYNAESAVNVIRDGMFQ